MSDSELSIASSLWSERLHGNEATSLSMLPIGDSFRFPSSPPDEVLIKRTDDGWYTNKGLKFKTGKHSSVIPIRSEAT